jgi:hypothetical protein
MNDRSATTTKDTLFRATSIQPATLIRTFAVGLHQGQRTWFPRKQAGHMTASRQPVQNVEKKTLANQGRPHMAQRVPEITEAEPIDDVADGEALDEEIDDTENKEVAA